MLESRENPYRAPTRSKKEKTMVQGKVSIPAGSVKLVKVRVEGDRRGNRVGHC